MQVHWAAETIAERALVNVEMSDPSCNLSLHAKLNLYLQTNMVERVKQQITVTKIVKLAKGIRKRA